MAERLFFAPVFGHKNDTRSEERVSSFTCYKCLNFIAQSGLLHSLFNSNCTSNSSTNHRVVAHSCIADLRISQRCVVLRINAEK